MASFRSLLTHLVVAILGGGIALGGYVLFNTGHGAPDLTANGALEEKNGATSGSELIPPAPAVKELQKTSRAFVAIAKALQPAVVNISTVQVLKQRAVGPPGGGGTPFNDPFFGPFDDFFGDDFFRHFFGAPGQAPQEQRRQGLGSGMIVDAEHGYILTNNHVIAEADEIKVTLADGRSFDATVIGTDPQTDVGVVQIKNPPKDLASVTLGDSDDVEVGDWAVAVGNPFGLNQTVTVGIISAKGRSNINVVDYENFIQTDAAINPGNSGGPLVNVTGQVIGINTAIFSRSGGYQGIGFAIPSNMASSVMKTLIKGEKIQRGFLGVYLQDLTEELAKNFQLDTTDGVLVSEVIADSPADKAGLKTGDVVVALDGKAVKNGHELRNRIGFSSVGSKVTLTVIRDGAKTDIAVELIERPGDEVAAGKTQPTSLLGISVTNLTADLQQRYQTPAKRGVVILQVDADKLGAQLGLQEGDVLLEINRRPTGNTEEFQAALGALSEKSSVLLLIDRQGRRMFLALNR